MFRLLACSVVTWCWLVAPAAASAWEEGVIAYRAGQFEEAYTLWLPLAISGDPRAQNNIGVLHENGWGIDLSLEQALDWYEKAASAGHAGAQRNLSDLRSRTRATTETTRAGTESADVRQSLDRWIADQHIPLALRNKLSGVEVDIVDVIPGLTFGRELLINDQIVHSADIIRFERAAIVGGIAVVVGYAGPSGTCCNPSPFVITFEPNQQPRLYGPLPTAKPTNYRVTAEAISFEEVASPGRVGSTWQWTPSEGLKEAGDVVFIPDSANGWKEFSQKTASHPSDLMQYGEIADQIYLLLGLDADWVLSSYISGVGSGQFVGDTFVGSGCVTHMCTELEYALYADMRTEQVYLAWKPQNETIVVRPAADTWPTELWARLSTWARRYGWALPSPRPLSETANSRNPDNSSSAQEADREFVRKFLGVCMANVANLKSVETAADVFGWQLIDGNVAELLGPSEPSPEARIWLDRSTDSRPHLIGINQGSLGIGGRPAAVCSVSDVQADADAVVSFLEETLDLGQQHEDYREAGQRYQTWTAEVADQEVLVMSTDASPADMAGMTLSVLSYD